MIPDVASDSILAYFDCSGELTVLPNTKVAMSVAVDLNKLFGPLYPSFLAMQQCRAAQRSSILTEEEFKASFGFIEQWFYQMVNGSPDNLSFPKNMSNFQLQNVLKKVVLPPTCSYETYTSGTLSCSLEYNGLSYLLGVDITLQLYVQQCSEGPFPKIYIGCKGIVVCFINGFVIIDSIKYRWSMSNPAKTSRLFNRFRLSRWRNLQRFWTNYDTRCYN
jgi:hypothetical protein